MVIAYNNECVTLGKNVNTFYSDVYERVLAETLAYHADEDRKEHGRLISMQHTLLNVNNKVIKSEEIESYFYYKDMEAFLGKEDVGPEDYLRLDSMEKETMKK